MPFEFVDRVGGVLPSRLDCLVSSGHEFVGCYSGSRYELSGLVNLCNMLNVSNLNDFHMLVFTYDGLSQVIVRAFDQSFIEAPLGLKDSVTGTLLYLKCCHYCELFIVEFDCPL